MENQWCERCRRQVPTVWVVKRRSHGTYTICARCRKLLADAQLIVPISGWYDYVDRYVGVWVEYEYRSTGGAEMTNRVMEPTTEELDALQDALAAHTETESAAMCSRITTPHSQRVTAGVKDGHKHQAQDAMEEPQWSQGCGYD